MIRSILTLVLCLMGLLPAFIITVIAFIINPIFGVIVAVYFLVVMVLAAVYNIGKIFYKKSKFK